MPEFNIVLCSQSLGTDISEMLAGALNDLGYRCRIQMFTFDPACINVVVPAIFFPPDALDRVPPSTVFYNVECLQHALEPNLRTMREILRRGLPVWDFSRLNAEWYATAGYADVPRYLPLGYSSAIDRVASRPWEERTVDVLFFGRLSQRRVDILARLMATPMTIGIFNNLRGAARDDLISRAKIVIDIPFFTPFTGENPRVAYCASNRKVCVSERPDYPLDRAWSAAVTFVPFDEIVATCEALAGDRPAILAKEQAAYEAMRSVTMAASAKAALDGTAPRLSEFRVGANP